MRGSSVTVRRPSNIASPSLPAKGEMPFHTDFALSPAVRMPARRANACGVMTTGTLPLPREAGRSAASTLRMIFSLNSSWGSGASDDALSPVSTRVPSSRISVADR